MPSGDYRAVVFMVKCSWTEVNQFDVGAFYYPIVPFLKDSFGEPPVM